MRKSVYKKGISAMLVVSLLITMLPLSSYAEEPTSQGELWEEESEKLPAEEGLVSDGTEEEKSMLEGGVSNVITIQFFEGGLSRDGITIGELVGENTAYARYDEAGLYADPDFTKAFTVPKFEPASGYKVHERYRWQRSNGRFDPTDFYSAHRLETTRFTESLKLVPYLTTEGSSFPFEPGEVTEEGSKGGDLYDGEGRLFRSIGVKGDQVEVTEYGYGEGGREAKRTEVTWSLGKVSSGIEERMGGALVRSIQSALQAKAIGNVSDDAIGSQIESAIEYAVTETMELEEMMKAMGGEEGLAEASEGLCLPLEKNLCAMMPEILPGAVMRLEEVQNRIEAYKWLPDSWDYHLIIEKVKKNIQTLLDTSGQLLHEVVKESMEEGTKRRITESVRDAAGSWVEYTYEEGNVFLGSSAPGLVVIFKGDNGYGGVEGGDQVAYVKQGQEGLYSDPRGEKSFAVPRGVSGTTYERIHPTYPWKEASTGRPYREGELGRTVWERSVILVPNLCVTTEMLPEESPDSVSEEQDEHGRLKRRTTIEGGEKTISDFFYDGNGNRTEYTYEVTYDGTKRLIRTTNALGDTLSGSYNADGDLISERTALGYTTQYEYDENDRLSKKIYGDGSTETYTYDGTGNLLTQTDGAGNTTRYTYDKENRVQSSTTPLGGVRVQSYTKEGWLKSITDPQGNETSYEYDREGNVIGQTDGLGNTTKKSYDSQGRVVEVTDPEGHTIRLVYDEGGNVTEVIRPDATKQTYEYGEKEKATKITDGAGNEYTYGYDGAGNLIKKTDGNGATTHYEYDGMHRLIREETAEGKVTEHSYDALGQLVSTRNGNGEIITFEYDADGRLVGECTPLGAETRYEYDERDRHTKTIHADGTETTYGYDGAGQLVRETDGRGNTTTYGYDGSGNLLEAKDPEGNSTKNTYNRNGERITHVKANGGEVRFAYDGNGNVVSVTDALGYTTTFTYDKNNRQTTTTNSTGAVSQYGYNRMGKLTEVITPNGGIIQIEYDGNGNVIGQRDGEGYREERSYDGNGNLSSVTDRRGNRTYYEYDKDNQLVKMTDANGGQTHYRYDGAGRLIETTRMVDGKPVRTRATYDGEGRVESTINELEGEGGAEGSQAHRNRYEYDQMGRVIREIKADETSVVSYRYDANGNVESQTDENGNTIRYTYDKTNRVKTIVDPKGGITAYTYTPTGMVKTETNALGGVTSYRYDANDNVLEVVDPQGHRIAYSYDGEERVKSATDSNGNTYGYLYDGNGNLIEVENPDGGRESYEYDRNDRLIAKRDSENYEIRYAYDGNGNVVGILDPRGTEQIVTYDALNQKIGEQIVSGQTTMGRMEYRYDALGRMVEIINRENGATTCYEYDSKGRMTAMRDANGNYRNYEYDALDRLIAETDERGVQRTYAYDGVGNLIAYTDGCGNRQTYEYDKMGNRIAYRDGNQNRYTYTYDALHRLLSETNPAGETTRFAYDQNGRIVAETDRNGNTTRYELDGNGNIVKAIDGSGTDTVIAYDSMNRPVSIKVHRLDPMHGVDEYQKTLYSYDHRGLVKQEVNAKGDGKTFVYDGNGNLLQETDEEGDVTDYAYNPMNRLSQIRYSDGKSVSYAYDGSGNLIEMKDWNGTTSIGVDLLDRITKVTDHNNRTVSYGYDGVGNKVSQVYPDGSKVTYRYDEENRPTSVWDTEGGETTYSYDGTGNPVKKYLPNGQASVYTYDNCNRLIEEKEYRTDGSLWYETSYQYDGEGNRLGQWRSTYEGGSKTATSKESQSYAYDRLNRMVMSQDATVTTHYIYDSVGNLIGEKTAEGITDYQYNNLNQLMKKKTPEGSYTYTYDRRGNRTAENGAKESYHYYYDGGNHLVEGRGSQGDSSVYEYNGLGMRIKNTTIRKGQREFHSRDYVLDYTSAENDDLYVYAAEGSKRYTQKHIYVGSERIAQITEDPTGQRERLLYVQEDVLGSTAHYTRKDGSLLLRLEYDAWGAPKQVETLLENDYLTAIFTGHPYDPVLGLYFAEARFYEPTNRQWMSVDPIKDGSSWYQYCNSNPVTYWDPTGLSWWDSLTEHFKEKWNEVKESYETNKEITQELATGLHEDMSQWWQDHKATALKVAVGVGAFALTAALAAATGGTGMLLIGTVIGALESGLDSYIDQAAAGVPADWKTIGKEAFKGAIIGGIAGGIGGAAMHLVGGELSLYGKSAAQVAKQLTARWAAGTAGAGVGGMATQFTADLMDGKSARESWQDTRNHLGEIWAEAAIMSLVSVAVEGKVAAKCFVAGTMVFTATGLVAIEDIQAGDLVLSANDETGEVAHKEVVQTFQNTSEEITHVTVCTQTGEEQTIDATPGHDFYTEGGEWVDASLLKEGTVLCLADGTNATVKSVVTEELSEPVVVYNFEVADFHTYFVGEHSILVHNMNCDAGGKGKRKKRGKKPQSTAEEIADDEFLEKAIAEAEAMKGKAEIDAARGFQDKVATSLREYYNARNQSRDFRMGPREELSKEWDEIAKLHTVAVNETGSLTHPKVLELETKLKKLRGRIDNNTIQYSQLMRTELSKLSGVEELVLDKIATIKDYYTKNGKAPEGFRAAKKFFNREGRLTPASPRYLEEQQGEYNTLWRRLQEHGEKGNSTFIEMDMMPDAMRQKIRNPFRLVVVSETNQWYFSPDHYETFIRFHAFRARDNNGNFTGPTYNSIKDYLKTIRH